MSFRALPGFRDFYPETMSVRRHIEAAWHDASRAAGFEEMDGPPLEFLELFQAKSGDAIVEELYAFEDKGGRQVALRAELTPTLARMVGARAQALRKPVKWYSVPQLFRYERQQRGRLREHFQWNVDVVGAAEVTADAEILAVALDGLRRLGLTEKHVRVRAFDRRLAEQALVERGVDDLGATLTKIDRGQRDELSPAVREWLDEPLSPEGEFGEFLAACEDFGLAGYVEPDKTIVRGLAYYTGIVFEIWDRRGELRAVAGGGRYDTLVEKLGGPSLPALGFGMGDVVLGELLKDHGLLPEKPARCDALVLPIGAAMAGAARQVARRLRDAGQSVDLPYGNVRVGKMLQAAHADGVRFAYVVGPDEWARGEIVRKELSTREESVVKLESLG